MRLRGDYSHCAHHFSSLPFAIAHLSCLYSSDLFSPMPSAILRHVHALSPFSERPPSLSISAISDADYPALHSLPSRFDAFAASRLYTYYPPRYQPDLRLLCCTAIRALFDIASRFHCHYFQLSLLFSLISDIFATFHRLPLSPFLSADYFLSSILHAPFTCLTCHSSLCPRLLIFIIEAEHTLSATPFSCHYARMSRPGGEAMSAAKKRSARHDRRAVAHRHAAPAQATTLFPRRQQNISFLFFAPVPRPRRHASRRHYSFRCPTNTSGSASSEPRRRYVADRPSRHADAGVFRLRYMARRPSYILKRRAARLRRLNAQADGTRYAPRGAMRSTSRRRHIRSSHPPFESVVDDDKPMFSSRYTQRLRNNKPLLLTPLCFITRECCEYRQSEENRSDAPEDRRGYAHGIAANEHRVRRRDSRTEECARALCVLPLTPASRHAFCRHAPASQFVAVAGGQPFSFLLPGLPLAAPLRPRTLLCRARGARAKMQRHFLFPR